MPPPIVFEVDLDDVGGDVFQGELAGEVAGGVGGGVQEGIVDGERDAAVGLGTVGIGDPRRQGSDLAEAVVR
jgi:hypothetical protein